MRKFPIILKNSLTYTQYFNFSICWKNTFRYLFYIGFHKRLTELSTIMFIFLKNWISILQPSNTQVDSKILCRSQKSLTLTQYLKFSIYWKNTFKFFLFKRFLHKTDGNFNNHVYIPHNLNLYSTTQYLNFSISWKKTPSDNFYI